MTFYHFFFVILVWEMQKMQKKCLPIWEIPKKMQKHDSQPGKYKKNAKNAKTMQTKNKKNDSCAGKMTFLDFLGRLWVQPPALDEKTTKKTTRK